MLGIPAVLSPKLSYHGLARMRARKRFEKKLGKIAIAKSTVKKSRT